MRDYHDGDAKPYSSRPSLEELAEHPYYTKHEYVAGTLFYNSTQYDSVGMHYDLHLNQVVVQTYVEMHYHCCEQLKSSAKV